ncbi:hypothetical protein ES703_87175 [subsurface metagenome]
MPDETGPDMSCVPYSRKRAYFILTVPFLILLILVAVYLWSVNFALALIFISLFVTANLLQAYCCAYQECPYAGGFCPAVAGIMPSSMLAKIILRKKVKRSKRLFDLFAAIAFLSLLGLIGFPLFWIIDISIPLAIGYFALNIVYYTTFFLAICPVCAIRNTCPGGKLQNMVLKNRE